MSKVPSIYNGSNKNSITVDNAQIRWCQDRCDHCKSIFTVTIYKNDTPSAYKCMSCDKQHLFSEDELKEMHLL